jgi:hydrogenase maturation protein HypF
VAVGSDSAAWQYPMAETSAEARVSVSVKGVVQGVGFRPFVYQLATKHKLRGWVCNTSEDVLVEI